MPGFHISSWFCCVKWSDLQSIFAGKYIVERTVDTDFVFVVWVAFIKQLLTKL